MKLLINNFLSELPKNDIIFIFLEFILVFLFLKSILYLLKNRNGFLIKVKRSGGSFESLQIMFGIATLFTVEIINNSCILGDYKNLIMVINLLIVFYLCFYSDWSRNKIIGFIEKIKNKTENHP
ncbi:MAG: hypothetical protein AAGU06_03705 [Candidatus Shapirobacteria bacterium]